MKTANQGELSTFGQGTCIVDITIGGVEHHVTLQDCLYAPEAVFNLISVGCMLQWGWDCVFKGLLLPSGPYCKFLHKGQSLRQVPMVGNLCQLDMRFIPPARLSAAPVTMEITVFVEQPLTWDTWHAHLGHPGGNSVKHLPIIATGIKVDKDTPLQHCEACIMAKHPRRPFPSSETPRANHMLDLIHSDTYLRSISHPNTSQKALFHHIPRRSLASHQYPTIGIEGSSSPSMDHRQKSVGKSR